MSVQVQIISPEKILVSRDVDMVVMPGAEGDIAAMPDHAPMVIMLRGGVVELHEGGRISDRYFVAGGFADITALRCTILADSAVDVTDLSATEAQARLEKSQAEWDAADKEDVAHLDLLMVKIQSAQAEIEAAANNV